VRYIVRVFLAFLLLGVLLSFLPEKALALKVYGGVSFDEMFWQGTQVPPDSTKKDSLQRARHVQDSLKNLPYKKTTRPSFTPIDRRLNSLFVPQAISPLFLPDPQGTQLKTQVSFDTALRYNVYEQIGEQYYRPGANLTLEQFNRFQDARIQKDYWKAKTTGTGEEDALDGGDLIPKIYLSPVFDRIFGGSYIDLNPNGFVLLDFGARWQRINNPAIPIRQQRNGGFEFDQQINMNVTGSIGEKLSITANFGSNNSFDFENNLKVEYTGYDEDILKKIEVGNVSMPVTNSLMTGAQSLFGIKTEMQFGRLYVTSVASTQRGRTEVLEVQGGSAQGREFEVPASFYDENRHFFLGHFFRDNYEQWLRTIPQVTSGVNVTRVEVYVMNRTQNTQTLRNILAFQDLGEGEVIFRDELVNGNGNVPNSNEANDFYQSLRDLEPGIRDQDESNTILANLGLAKGTDFEFISGARKLDDEEYTFNPQLGYVTLFRKLQNDEILAVSYEYTYQGQAFKVGELTEDYQRRGEDETILLKLLRPSEVNVNTPTWDLMMKNIYSLNANQIEREGFELRIIYQDDATGLFNPNLQEGRFTKDIPLVQVLGLDTLNQNGDPQPDGVFDYVEGLTVNQDYGLVIFPVLEPFGARMRSQFDPNTEQFLIDRYVFDTLYRTTRNDAEQIANLDKFFIKGRVQSGSASEIVLPGINVAEGSVVVFSGSTPLNEGTDYTVDYLLGKVRIINQSVLNSGRPLRINFEKADPFNFQTRSLLGSRFDYRLTDKINFGATVLYLTERPPVSRINIGDEPTRNLKYGFDVNYQGESRFLTRVVDALPLIQTKAPSTITFNGEFAQILPGTSNQVQGEGTSYIDDFEAAITPFNLGSNPQQSWRLGATPTTLNREFFVGGNLPDNPRINDLRAKLAWYTIDNIFYRIGGVARPENIDEEDRDYHSVRQINPQEIFAGRNRTVINTNLQIFDMAYYPSERGPYNYRTDNLDFQTGRLNDPERNFGAITRAITSETDFDKANIEYIEFWLMDPFVQTEFGRVLDGVTNDNNRTGGKVFFQLGNVSEDVMRDGRHAFENGLPITEEDQNFTTNNWGVVTTKQYLNNAFDSEPGAREQQDVGLDGLNNENEATFFDDYLSNLQGAVSNAVFQAALLDPSNDNFRYYLGDDLDANDIGILERYKDFNGFENNSPETSTALPFTPSSTNLPDNEDLNNDNTVTDLESFFEYQLSLNPDSLRVGVNNIVDVVTSPTLPRTGEQVNWYLFRIPIRQPDRTEGNISSFKTIRYMRMFLTSWEQPVVLRLAKFQLVGSQWRKYREDLLAGGLYETPEPQEDDFTVGVVNIEENGQGNEFLSPYVLPPGINRDRDITSPINRNLNEQSLLVCVDDLDDGDSRAVFKRTALDLINYGRIKMFFHADSDDAADGEVTAFLRLGRDFDENYYEIEVPLTITQGTTPEAIWPSENEVDMPLEQLYALKSARDRAGANTSLPFPAEGRLVGSQRIRVVGNPRLSNIQVLMIGVRNPVDENGLRKSLCIWANELRVTDFDNTPGYAANARLNAKLADLGAVNVATRYTSVGFGSVQSRVSERTREETTDFDFTTNLNLDRFFPQKWGLRLPVFAAYQTLRSRPFWDPLEADTPLDAVLLSFDDPDERREYERIVQDVQVRRSLNFTNVGKNRTAANRIPLPWDISNFSFTYAWSEITRRNINTESFIDRNVNGGFTYNYQLPPLSIKPFAKSKAFSNAYLQLIKDINFSPLPNNVLVRMDLRRRFVRTQLRNSDLTISGIPAQFEKFFTFDRNYGLSWSITEALSLDYNARANAIIDEPAGDINTQAKRDSIITNIRNFGRMKTYDQNLNFGYELPFAKFPLTSFVRATATYNIGYTWTAGAINQQATLGNSIQNRRQQSIQGSVNFIDLYNRVRFLKEANQPGGRRPGVLGANNPQDTTKKGMSKGVKGALRFLMAVRNANFNYTVTEGTFLPGFLPTASWLGMSSGFDAPGWDFILGSQDISIRDEAVANGWYSNSPLLTQPILQNRSEDLSLGATIQPFDDLTITLTAKKNKSDTYQEIFRFDTVGGPPGFRSLTPSRNGSYNITFSMFSTAFIGDDDRNISPIFTEFEENRAIILERLRALNPTVGAEYDLNSQDVLVPAFIAAYAGREAGTVSTSPFPRIPIPNWNVDYKGLGNLPGLKEIFSSVAITHGYSSRFSINNYTSSLQYTDGSLLTPSNNIEQYPQSSIVQDGAVVPVYILNQVSISEQFSPLIGVDMRTKSKVSIKFAYARRRDVALTLSNAQVTEVNNKDYTLDVGFVKSNLKLPFRSKGRVVTLKNDVQFRLTFTINDSRTVQRKIDEDPTVTNGNVNLQLSPTVDYKLNDKLNLRIYFNRNVNTPRLSSSFQRTTTAFGFQLRYSLTQ